MFYIIYMYWKFGRLRDGWTAALDGCCARSFPRTLEHYWNKSILGERLGGGTRPTSGGFAKEKWYRGRGSNPHDPKGHRMLSPVLPES